MSDSTIKNIIMITSDQHRGDCYGFEGRSVKTPHLDKLARDGTRFNACITPNLVCQPARASILTGLLPLTHGVRDNGIDLPLDTGQKGFAGSLSKAGYDTGIIGKAHLSTHHTFSKTGRPECQFSQPEFAPPWGGPYMGFEHVELMVEGHNYWLPAPPPAGLHHSQWHYSDGLGEERNRLYSKDLGPSIGAPQTSYSALPVAWHNSTWVGDRTVEYLRQQREKPFFLWASFADPHHPFDCPEPWSRLHHPDDVDLPLHRTTDFDRRPWWHRASMESTPSGSAEVRALRQNFSRIPTQPDNALRHIIANYYGMISLVDHQVGRIRKALHEYGLDENTLIVFTSDHGDWMGDHGLMLKGPMAYEGLLRVGMIWAGPGVKADQVVKDPVSTLDLASTFTDYGHAQNQGVTHGRSLRPFLEGKEMSRDFAYSEWDVAASRCGVELKLRTARTQDWKLTLELNSGAGEMYCLKEDPHEMHNLFNCADYSAAQAELTEMIHSRPDDALKTPLQPSGIA